MCDIIIDNEKVSKNQYCAETGTNTAINGKKQYFTVS